MGDVPRTDAMEFEDVTSHFSERFTIIDNNLFFPYSAMPSARRARLRGASVNYWPEWGIKLIDEVRAKNYAEIARMMMVEEAMPFYKLGADREGVTSGDGYLTSCAWNWSACRPRCRPPTRDVRPLYRQAAYDMMEKKGVPRLLKLVA